LIVFSYLFLRKFKKTLPYVLKKRRMKKQVVDLGIPNGYLMVIILNHIAFARTINIKQAQIVGTVNIIV